MVNYNANFMGFRPIPKNLNPLRTDAYVALNGSITTGTTVAVAATTTSGNAETYDFTTAGTFYLYYSDDAGVTFNSYGPASIQGATAAATTEAEVVADINANAMIAQFITASDGSGVVLTAKGAGADIEFYVGGTANTALGFTAVSAATAAAGTGTYATVSVDVTNALGKPIPYFALNGILYAASTGATKDATSEIVTASVGSITSGAFSNTFTALTNRHGRFTFKIADTGEGASTCYVEFTDANGKVLDGIGRTEVTTGT